VRRESEIGRMDDGSIDINQLKECIDVNE